ncbi:hypothetical protein VNI00_011234 [Paramarasmius palmivorus]|uniref:Uncharacterized protein n=1 Tax=Paramarasmius palmivorus TaxID=297713 RepID=A0AAW0CCZ4_9AGAR
MTSSPASPSLCPTLLRRREFGSARSHFDVAKLRSLGNMVSKGFYTLYLFMKSDQAAVTLPSLAVAVVAAGPTDMITFLQALLWMEIHLLAFNVRRDQA